MKGKGLIVLLPTYNEAENIEFCLQRLYATFPECSVLVIDDGSKDGTREIVKNKQKQYSTLQILERAQKEGLGKAYISGMKWALQKDFEYILQMDADLSHRPEDLPKFFEVAPFDGVIGSRYVPGGKIENWSYVRRQISKCGNLYANFFLKTPYHDLTGGFNLWTRNTLLSLPLDEVKSEGYGFQIEMKYRAFLLGKKLKEVPITFFERENGHSKMSSRIVIEAMRRVPGFRKLSR